MCNGYKISSGAPFLTNSMCISCDIKNTVIEDAMLVAIFRLILTYSMFMRGKHFHQSPGLTGMYLLGQAVRQLFLSKV